MVTPMSLKGTRRVSTKSTVLVYSIIENKRVKRVRCILAGQDPPERIRETLISFPGNHRNTGTKKSHKIWRIRVGTMVGAFTGRVVFSGRLE
jgi:hypothetical protein